MDVGPIELEKMAKKFSPSHMTITHTGRYGTWAHDGDDYLKILATVRKYGIKDTCIPEIDWKQLNEVR
jgi:hypothetical protein